MGTRKTNIKLIWTSSYDGDGVTTILRTAPGMAAPVTERERDGAARGAAGLASHCCFAAIGNGATEPRREDTIVAAVAGGGGPGMRATRWARHFGGWSGHGSRQNAVPAISAAGRGAVPAKTPFPPFRRLVGALFPPKHRSCCRNAAPADINACRGGVPAFCSSVRGGWVRKSRPCSPSKILQAVPVLHLAALRYSQFARHRSPPECARVLAEPTPLSSKCPRFCGNGRCFSSGKCCCQSGWEGELCNKAKCERACANGGACVKPNKCLCKSGFQGATCDQAERSLGSAFRAGLSLLFGNPYQKSQALSQLPRSLRRLIRGRGSRHTQGGSRKENRLTRPTDLPKSPITAGYKDLVTEVGRRP